MAKFKFRLAAVLKLRKTREEESLRVLGAAQRAYQEELTRKLKLVGDLKDSLTRREELGSQPNRSIGALSFQLEDDFIEGQKYRIVRQDRIIVRASKVVEKALRAYLFAKRQSLMIEKISEREHLAFKREQSKREQKQQDDFSIMRDHLREKVA